MTAAHQASLSITNSQNLLKLMSIELVMSSNHLILCHPLLLLHSIFPSIRVFSKEWVLCIKWPNYWSFSISISPYNEYSGLISFRMDWLDLPSVQGTLKSHLQHHSSKASIIWCSAFFIVKLSHLYMTTGKTIALTRQTFSGKVMSLLFNILSQFSHSVVSNSLWPHEPQHARPPCPSPTARVYPNSCPLNWWCHPTISSSVIPFSSCPQSLPASGSFQMSQLFASGGQSIGALASVSVLPVNIQGWFPLGLTGLISLLFKGLLECLLQHHNSKASILQYSAFFMVQLSHPSTTTGKAIALIIWTFVGNVMSLLLNMLSMFVIAFLPKRLDLVCWVCFDCHIAIDSVV